MKLECLPTAEYNSYGPLFIKEVERGSEIWRLLVEKHPGVLYVLVFIGAIASYQYYENKSVDTLQKKLEILNEHFPEASAKDQQRFVDAWNFFERNGVVKDLIEEGLYKIEMSKDTVRDSREDSAITILDNESNKDTFR